MRGLTGALGSWRDRLRSSISHKIGGILVALAFVGGIILLLSLYLTTELIQTSGTVNIAGMQRARVYKLGSLVQQLHNPSTSEAEKTAIRYEIMRWRRAFESWQAGTADSALFEDLSSDMRLRVTEIQERWANQMSPLLDVAVSAAREEGMPAAQKFIHHTDMFVEALSDITRGLDESRTDWMRTLYRVQVVFFALLVVATLMALVLLRRVVLEPLKLLTGRAEQLSRGNLQTSIPVPTTDELGQLARTFEELAQKVRHKVEELETLHTIMQGVCSVRPESQNEGLRGLVDRAAALLKVDLAVLLVRHHALEFWVIEAASGALFESVQKKILLVEETPASNRALETKEPVVVSDVREDEAQPSHGGERFGARSLMAVPLVRSNECNGVLLFITRDDPREFTPWDVRLAQQIASYAALAVEDVRAFAEATSELQAYQNKLSAMERHVAELTHEVKAPVGRVLEFAAWLEQDYAEHLDERARRYLGWIKKEAKDLGEVAQRTIDIARLAHVQTPIESVEVGSVVAEVLERLTREIDDRGIEITVHSELPRVACRRIHLMQVLENLVSNAIKYMGSREKPAIEVGAERRGGKLRLFVRDNGVGIDPSMQERIFDPFQRLGTVEAPGVGVGLAIVKAVVEHYGGTVTVSSEPGVGSAFFFTLPVLEEK